MSTIFTRPIRPMPGQPGAFVSPVPTLSQRAFEVLAVSSALPLALQGDLHKRFLAKPAYRSDALPDLHLTPYRPGELGDLTRKGLRKEVREELKRFERLLDAPLDLMSGLSRNRLLAVHTTRLRQLWEECARRRWPQGPLVAFRALLA
jgi:hypothetical protein